MRWIRWISPFKHRQRAGRRPAALEPFRPRLYRLEDRRVLDVGAVFSTATGQLQLLLTNTADTATITVNNGNIVVTDSQQQQVAIDVDGAGPANVSASSVDSIAVDGDAAPSQTVIFDSPFALPDGLSVAGDVELVQIRGEISRVESGPIAISSGRLELSADLLTTDQDITFSGEVQLNNSVRLTGRDIVFEGTIDDDGVAFSPSDLNIEASRLTRLAGPIGSTSTLTRLQTDAAGRTELNAAVHLEGDTVLFRNAVVLTNDVTFISTGESEIVFGSTVDSVDGGGHSLSVSAADGQVRFQGNIGAGANGDQRLGSLTIVDAADGVFFASSNPEISVQLTEAFEVGSGDVISGQGIVLGEGAQRLSVVAGGAIRLNGATVLASDVSFATAGGNITFTSDAPIDSDQDRVSSLMLDAAAGAVFFNADVGSSLPVRGLKVSRADGGVTFGAADTKSPGGSGPVRTIRSVDAIVLGEGGNVISGGIRFNAGQTERLEITTTNDAVRLNGAVRLDSDLLISTGDGSGDIDFLSGAVDSASGENNDLTLDAGTGAIRFNGDIGSLQPLGNFVVARAGAGLTFGTSDVVAAGAGPVRSVNVAGDVDLGTGNNAIVGTGIVLNAGPASDFEIQSTGGSVRFNGAVVLDSDLRVDVGADVLFTNDAPVDSRSGEIHSITIDAPTGTVAFNEDLGRNASLGALTIVRAGGGFFLGQSTNEVPGSGGLGPVEIVRLDGPLDLGQGLNAIGGAGIVLSGSAIAAQRISTTDDAVRFNGPVTLETDVEITTGAAGGDIIFTHVASVDSGALRHGSLTLNAGSEQVVFSANLGAARALGQLTVVRADSGVLFGAAPANPPNATAGAVSLIRTDRPIDIGVGTNVIGGSGIRFNDGLVSDVQISTTNDSVRLNGAVAISSGLSINTGDGPGDVLFTSAATIDSIFASSAELRIDAGGGAISFNADIGAQDPLIRLIVDEAGAGVVFGGADVATADGLGPVSQVHTVAEIQLGNDAPGSDSLAKIVFNAGSGTLELQSDQGNIQLHGPVTLESDVSIVALSGELILTADSPINGQAGESRSLDVRLVQVAFGATVGENVPLDVITINAGSVEFQRSVRAARIFAESVTNQTIFRAAIHTTDADDAGLELNSGDILFEGPVLAEGDGRVVINVQRLLQIGPNADFRIDGEFIQTGAGAVELAGDIATSGDAINIASWVKLTSAGGQVLMSTVAGGSAAGADIHLSSVDGLNPGTENLLLNAGNAGDIRFDSTIGFSTRLGIISIVEAHDVRFAEAVNALRLVQLGGSGRTSFLGPVNFGHPALPSLDITNRDILFAAPVTTTGQGEVRLNVVGELDLAAAADFNLNGAFVQTGTGRVFASSDIITTADDVSFTGDITLREDIRLDTGVGTGSVTIAGEVDSLTAAARSLTIRAAEGDVLFNQAIGSNQEIRELVIESARNVTLNANVNVQSLEQMAGSGETLIERTVTTTAPAGIRLTTRNITLNGTLDPRGSAIGGDVRLVAEDTVTIRGSILSVDQIISISAGNHIALGPQALVQSVIADVTLVAGTDAAMNGTFLAEEGSLIDSGSGVLVIAATGETQVSRFLSTTRIRLESSEGKIIDRGDVGGADLVAPEIRLSAALGIGTPASVSGKDAELANPLEIQTNTVAAVNLSAGGIYLNNSSGGTLTIGVVDGLAGLRNGGEGTIEIINSTTLIVDAPVLSQGGGHTRLRAEMPGDLIVNQPIQNTGGDGSIVLFSGGNLIIHNSLPEPPALIENPNNPEQYFEIMVSGEGAIRGEAHDEVIVDDGPTDFVIIRTATGQITNVPPILSIRTLDQGGSDIDEQGRGFVEVKIGDGIHLETNFHIQIDWGDGEIESFPIPGTIHPERLPGNTDPRFVGGDFGLLGQREPGLYIFTHKYFSHPNPNDPAAPIPIRVELRTDARASGDPSIDANRPQDTSAIFNGIRFVNNVSDVIFTSQDAAFSVPGTGGFTFVKVVESVIVPVELRTTVLPPPVQASVSFTATGGLRNEFRSARFESQTQVEYRLFLRVVDDVAGTESEERIELDLAWLDDPLRLFRSRPFPNGHYRVYLEEVRTRRVRLILDVHIFNGKVVPENFRDGASEKQPGAGDAGQQPERAQADQPGPAAEPAPDAGGNAAATADVSTQVASVDEEFPSLTRAARRLRRIASLHP